MEKKPGSAETAPRLTVIIPLYNEEGLFAELERRLAAALDSIGNIRWRVLFVNDGSSDRTGEMLEARSSRDPRFQYIELSRNFGHQAAIAAGLAEAEGDDAAVIMDGDLEDPPEVIPELVAAWRAGGQVVRAERRSRHEKGLRRLGFFAFHKFFRYFSKIPIPAQSGVFGLLDGKAVRHINRLAERHRFFPGLRAWLGFDQRAVYYDRGRRGAGRPKQNLRRLIRYAMDALFSFSYVPLRVFTAAGIFISFCGFSLGFFFAIRRLLGVETADIGFTTTVTLILFLGGVQLIGIGIIGEYLGRVYDEVKRRPLYIIKRRRAGEGENKPL